MGRKFVPKEPLAEEAFPTADKPFPIIEVFGYERRLRTPEARKTFADRACPFSGTPCEKFRQYKYGYCSVTYRAAADSEYQTYAVCDHRLDGQPIDTAVSDFFGDKADSIVVVPEVVTNKPKQSFDFVAFDPDSDDFVGIEAQAIDLRGGGVGPAFESLLEGRTPAWRYYFTKDAERRGTRKDTVAYGVNMANIYKRLGLQVAEKGALLRHWGGRLYVVVQDLPFEYLKSRVPLDWQAAEAPTDDWEITVLTFDYTGEVLDNGQMEFLHRKTYRVKTIEEYASALLRPTSALSGKQFLQRVRKKAGL